MSQSHGPYKSQLFSTLNRQSQRLRDRLGTTVRQIKVAAEWGVQALIYPFYWLLHPQKWLGPMLGASSTSSPPALPSFPQEKDQDYADLSFTSDHPIQSVLATVQPWLLEPDPAPAVALTDNLNDYLRESLGSQAIDQKGSAIAIAQKPALPAGAVTFALPPTTSPSLLSHWGHQLKTLFHRPDSTIVIQGIACRCSDRRLVLTTQDNLSLDILSLAQQQTLNTLIRQELAQFCYQSRRQWALTQQQWRGIPLINGKSQQVIAPLDWLWQGIYRWQTRPESPGQLIAVAAPSLPPLPPIQDWVGQTTTALAHHPVIEATVVKSQRVSAQIIDAIPLSAFPPALQHLGEDLRQKLAQGMATSENTPDLSPDPFALKVLIQAAIAYFFGPSSSPPLASPGQESPALTDGDRDSPSPWLQWEELFAELPQPPLSQPLLLTTTAHRTVALSETAWTEETIDATDHWHGSAQPTSPITPEQALVTASPQAIKGHQSSTAAMTANPVQGQPLSTATVADPWDEVWVESSFSSSPAPRKLSSAKAMAVASQPQALETAFDWIETSAKTLGYDKHILVWCLEWLDRLVYWLEVALGRIWQWFKQWFKQGTALQRK